MNFAFFKPSIKKKIVVLAILKGPSTSLKVRWAYETLSFSKFRFVLEKQVLSQFLFSVPRGFPLKTPSICGPRETLCFSFLTRASLRKFRLKGKWPGSRNDQTWKWWSHMKYCFIEKSCLLMLVTLAPLVTFCRCGELRTNTLSKFK